MSDHIYRKIIDLTMHLARSYPQLRHFYKQFPEGISQQPQILDNLTKHATDFEKKVWKATCLIPFGSVENYSFIAAKIGMPKAYRAVANALARNKVFIAIPCHRVIRKNQKYGGYALGIKMKMQLIWHEKRLLEITNQPKRNK
jgi:O-6-methylguanine DNA methyltransferase